MIEQTLKQWHELLVSKDPAGLQQLLAEEVVFHSPVVHSPQQGKPITSLYLGAAMQVLANPSFRYLREVASGDNAVLEFETEINGIHINGVDMIRCNEAGQIVDFKVMLRPLQAVNLVHQMMGQRLSKA
ncbi:nuclear transport factor 2 family protein [Aestuariirhabdus litorea]|uniref:Nuclear transport factor 2 family protein n=1 Tax=Aestuariirhabdus litorea TaxID=2528527 RepID=A0A3P3VJ85_9GAMM|nr:nuclear transport factor 2 family protein [Aestuariirhabdus litorea]RRJ82750.1 nuclear transport factor 2 family protein [Aestuariirhabdus litorea]RWW92911.1 nuclear transport factor 2 family protein [Endozoicomonadaceae bacterium GTF-13]